MELQQYKRRAKRLATGKQNAALVLPQEIVCEILTFLSVATLLRLKSVSKQWYALIRDRNFIDKHLRRSKSFSIAYKDKVQRLPNSPTNIGLLNNQFVPIAGCRGLLLQCAVATSKYFIRNPATRHILDLPDPQKSSLGMSLAYVKTTGEYKVISVHTDPDEASREGCEILTITDHGDLGWKQLKMPDFMEPDSKGNKLVTMPTLTAIHFLKLVTTTSFYYLQVNSLDLVTDTFSSTIVPKWLFSNSFNVRAFVVHGYLGIGAIDAKKKDLHVFFLRDHRQPTWEKLPVVYHLDWLDSAAVANVIPFCIQKEILWFGMGGDKVIGYNTNTKRVIQAEVAREGKNVGDRIYMNHSSLVSLKDMRLDTDSESIDLNEG